MKRGPKPQTNILSVQPISGMPNCPSHLDAIAKRQWRKVTKVLNELGILSASDSDALELYVTVYSRWRQAEQQVKEHGLTVISPNGYPQQSPWLNVANQCIKQMNSLMSNFGMSPAARAKVNMVETHESDELTEFLESKGQSGIREVDQKQG